MSSLDRKPPRIFVADDDRAILDLITTRLDLAGYNTLQARDGWAALDGIYASRPAAVVLDIGMPRLDGLGVLRHLRKTPSFASLPVMIVTARNTPMEVRSAMELGARDFLAKPFEDAQLLSRVARMLRRRAPPRQEDQITLAC
ncbi:MAG: response regulator [Alphaproteobacteria bacterium]|nr:response regulator [Alphaproteobacteria bacterium]